MQKLWILAVIVIIIAGFLLFKQSNRRKSISEQYFSTAKIMNMSSPAFAGNSHIPAKYTCDGDNINPSLLLNDISEKAKSLALIMDDPDAPAGTWVHWLVWNINPAAAEIPENSIPAGAVEGVTSFGSAGYGGPCPHSGTHRYFFKLYALDVSLQLPGAANKKDLEKAMSNHVIAQTETMGTYSRK